MKSKNTSASTPRSSRLQKQPAFPVVDILTPSEIEALQQDAIKGGAFMRNELARIFLETDLLQKKYGKVLAKEDIEGIKQHARETLARLQEEADSKTSPS